MASHRNAFFIEGDQTTRSTLTNAYTGAGALVSEVVPIGDCRYVSLEIEYTMGTAETGNSIQFMVEFADQKDREVSTPDTAEWYRQITQTIEAYDATVTVQKREYSYTADSAAATYDRICVTFPVHSRYMRVSFKESGVASNYGSLSAKVVLDKEF